MNVIYRLEDFNPTDPNISITIGNFDGVHLGHQAIFSQMRGQTVVLTFSNHPLEVLKKRPFHRLITTTHRLSLFEQYHIDTVILLPFTDSFAKQTAEIFLETLRRYVPFSHLALGHDARIGHDRQGNTVYMQKLAEKIGFDLAFLPPVQENGTTISSSEIRNLIQNGLLSKASALLGRPYSIHAIVERGAQRGRLLGCRTANLNVHALVLPPLGVYAVHTTIDTKHYLGVANLGCAPTLHAKRPPLLEVHLIGYEGNLYQQELEVVFDKFLRPEKRFYSIEELQSQIQADIRAAKQ